MNKFLFFSIIIFAIACQSKQKVEKILLNGHICSVEEDNNGQFIYYQAMAIDKGKIVALGTDKEIMAAYETDDVIDAEGKSIYPGFIDPHCHFLGYGRLLFQADLSGSQSADEMLIQVLNFGNVDKNEWLLGRGWDNTSWTNTAYPSKDSLDKYFPNRPVLLKRIDGHAALVNSEALKRAGIDANTKVDGGKILLDENGEPTGILIDNAVDLVTKVVPKPSLDSDKKAVTAAQDNCLSKGLTMVVDAGLPLNDLILLTEMDQEGLIKIFIDAMISSDSQSVAHFQSTGPFIGEHIRIASIKCYFDGALGSRGALLLKPYSDQPMEFGLQLTPDRELDRIAKIAFTSHFQLNTHAIGDSAVRKVLSLYSRFLPENNDLRWRIEHCQVVNKADLPIFKQYNVIPSVQATHATSDMNWAGERLGSRITDAYSYQELLSQNGWLVNGSDFPVEDINPLFGFYAAVSRKDKNGDPVEGFLPENKLTREQALKAMTIWAAKGSFMEKECGSLSVGKKADFVLLDQDLLTAPEETLFDAKVLATYLEGIEVYSRP